MFSMGSGVCEGHTQKHGLCPETTLYLFGSMLRIWRPICVRALTSGTMFPDVTSIFPHILPHDAIFWSSLEPLAANRPMAWWNLFSSSVVWWHHVYTCEWLFYQMNLHRLQIRPRSRVVKLFLTFWLISFDLWCLSKKRSVRSLP